jgi:hypothetical protein
VLAHPGAIDPSAPQQLALQPVHQREVRARARRQVDVGLARDRRLARVDAEHPRRIGTAPAVEDPHPQDGLGLGDVVAVERDRVAVVDVGVGAGLPVRAEGGLQRGRRGCRAQARVAVHVRRADPRLADHRERVVLLQEQLPGRVEADPAPPARLGEQRLRARDDAVHGGVPVALDQPPVAPDQRPGQAIRRVVGLPAVDVLRIESPVVDAILPAAANPDDPPVADRQVDAVAVGVQDRGRGRPAFGVGLELRVDAFRPALATPVRRPLTPRVGDPVHPPALPRRRPGENAPS